MALAFATCVGVACADDPASSPGGSGGSAGKGGSSNAGGTAGSSNAGGTAGKGGTGGKGGTSGAGGTNSDGGTNNAGGTNSDGGTNSAGGTGGDAGGGPVGGEGGMIDPGTGGMPDPGTGGAPDPGTGGAPDPGTGGAPDPGGGGQGGSGEEPPVEPNDLLPGWSFETGTELWAGHFTGGSVSTAYPHTGLNSFAMTARGGTWAGGEVNLLTIIEPGASYTFSAWVATAAATATNEPFKLSTQVAPFGAVGTVPTTCGGTEFAQLNGAGAAVTNVTPGTWVKLTGTFTVPATCTAATKFVVYVEGPATNVVMYIDDAELYKNP